MGSAVFRTRLYCELGELLESGDAFGAELVCADHVRGLDPGQSRGGGMESLETHHWGGDVLDEAVILFQNIVQIFGLQDPYDAPWPG